MKPRGAAGSPSSIRVSKPSDLRPQNGRIRRSTHLDSNMSAFELTPMAYYDGVRTGMKDTMCTAGGPATFVESSHSPDMHYLIFCAKHEFRG